MTNKCSQAYKEVLSTGRLNSDNYTLADFYDMDSDDIFAKTIPFEKYFNDYTEKGYNSYQRTLLSECNNRVIIQDPITGELKKMIMMASNNYLGLSTHPKVIEAGINAYKKYGVGPGSAPLLGGTYDITRTLEEKLAKFKGCEDAITFSSGYAANVGTISALLRKGDVAIVDRLDHASIIDGCRLSGANIEVFQHQDLTKLKRCLEMSKKKYKGKLIIVDGIYSMHGDICPLPEIKEIADHYGAKLMVDDAHAIGVVGEHGRGTADYFGIEGSIDLVIGTLCKTLGATGGFLASSKEVVEYIRFHARSYFFSAALTPSTCAAAIAALEVIEEEPERREQLHKNVNYLQNKLVSKGLSINKTVSGILTLVIGNDVILRKMSKKIHELGLYINPVPFPAVPKGQARFRISLMATHTQEDLDEAADIIDIVYREFNNIETRAYATSTSS
jgi:glycine C-acetyltransferase